MNSGRRRGSSHALLLMVFITAVAWVNSASSETCYPVAIGVQPAPADTAVYPFACRGWGEVFVATDTLIHSISVWRPAQPAYRDTPRQLFITETFDDPQATPDVSRVLLTGSVLVIPNGDGVHPVEYRWTFDPPFALPHRGKFFFDIMADNWTACTVMADTTDPYPGGVAVKTSPDFNCSQPGPPFDIDDPKRDLAFQVQFCGAGPVGVPPPRARPLALSAAPNPFQRELHVSFDLPSSTFVRLAVYDLTGRRVATLVDGVLDPGPHSATWGAPSAIGGRAGTGMYFIRLEAAGRRLNQTVVRIE
jgi:hypothetical protein